MVRAGAATQRKRSHRLLSQKVKYRFLAADEMAGRLITVVELHADYALNAGGGFSI